MNGRSETGGRTVFGTCLMLALVTFFIYSPVRHFSFVNFDDPEYVVDNAHINQGLTWHGVEWSFGMNHWIWHPLSFMTHMIDCELYGLDAGGHHMTNVFFHMANGVLLLLVMHRLTGAFWRSAMVAALFALHPLRVESVAWVTERKDVLSQFFGLLALWSYAHYVAKPSIARYGSMTVLLALSLMSKAMLITFPFLLLLLDVWPLRRLGNGEANGGGVPRRSAAFLIAEKLPLLGICLIVMALNVVSLQSYPGALKSASAVPFVNRLGNAVVAYCAYIQKSLWPQGLAVLYQTPDRWPAMRIGLSVLCVVVVTLIAVAVFRRHRFVAIGWFWFIGTLVPVIGLVQSGEQAFADRFTYFPAIGLSIVLVWAGFNMFDRNVATRRAGMAIAVVILVLLTMATRSQIQHWKNGITLFERATTVTTDNYVAHFQLATSLRMFGHTDRAIEHYSRAASIKPDFVNASMELATLYAQQGQPAKAKETLKRLTDTVPQYFPARLELAKFLEARDTPKAVEQYRLALKAKPDLLVAHNRLAVLLIGDGLVDDAIVHFQRAVDLRPDDADMHANLGTAQLQAGQFAKAVESFEYALKLRPGMPRAVAGLEEARRKQLQKD